MHHSGAVRRDQERLRRHDHDTVYFGVSESFVDFDGTISPRTSKRELREGKGLVPGSHGEFCYVLLRCQELIKQLMGKGKDP